MRYLLIACVLSVGWFGLYALARELASPPLTLLTLQHLAALRRRPKNFAQHSGYGPSVSSPIAESKPPSAVSATEVNNSKPFWVEALMPARVHSGPTVETPIIERDAVNTPLRVTGHKQGWFSVVNPKTAASGWVYWRYLGAIADPNQRQVASVTPSVHEAVSHNVTSIRQHGATRRYATGLEKNRSVRSNAGRRYATAIGKSRSVRSNARTTRSTTLTKADRPPRQSTGEMASLLERSFSGY
jgi:hypothetical protein